MPSGHSSGSGFSHSSGHFSGGSSHSFSHSSGHFGGSSSSSRSSGHFTSSRSSFSGTRPVHRPWYRPRVVVFGGRQVYLGTGRASAFSVLGVLLVIALMVSVFLGISWSNVEDTLSEQREEYTYYQEMAQYAYEHPVYRYTANVNYEPEEYEYSGKFCINYSFETPSGIEVKGHSYFVYTYNEVLQLWDNGNGTVEVALDCQNTEIVSWTDSVPLDYKDMSFEADEEYVANLDSRNTLRIGTFIMIGVTVLLGAMAILIPLTAKKATAEQIAANNQTSTDSQSQSTPTGTWRCDYCNTVNDNSKDRCDGCGAKRQK